MSKTRRTRSYTVEPKPQLRENGLFDRPLTGPHSHPYLRVTNAATRAVRRTLPANRLAAIEAQAAKVAERYGASFADVVRWALAERHGIGVAAGNYRTRTAYRDVPQRERKVANG